MKDVLYIIIPFFFQVLYCIGFLLRFPHFYFEANVTKVFLSMHFQLKSCKVSHLIYLVIDVHQILIITIIAHLF